jgi:transglutaminase-like putative cysteine protease
MKTNRKKQKAEAGIKSLAEIGPEPTTMSGWSVWLNLFFLFLALGTAIFSIEQAKWIEPQPYFTMVLFFAIVLTGLLTAVHLKWWALHPAMIVVGALVVLWQGAMILPSGSGMGKLFAIFSAWLGGGAGLQESDGKIIFGTLLVVLTWLTGYLATWALLHRNNAWAAVSTGLVILIINLSNLPGKNFLFLVFFLIAAVLLLLQTNVIRQQTVSGNKTRYSGKSLFYLALSLCGFTVLAFSISWVMPQPRLSALQNAIASNMPWKDSVQDSGFNILNSVPSKKNVSTAAKLQDLTFGTFWNMGDDIKYTVISPQPAYWQVNVYDEYTSDKWVSNGGTEEPVEKKMGWEDEPDIPGKTRIEYEITPNLSTDVVLFTGEFISADMPVIIRRGVNGEITGVRSPRVLSPGETYSVRVYVADNSENALSTASTDYPEEIKAAYLQLPAGFSPRVKALSDNLTQNVAGAYGKITAIDTYLAGIPYSREVVPLPAGADAVEDFLFTQQKGFCIHFASAMTVMLRAEGIPARMAVGYLPGNPGKKSNIYLLRDKHFHAWTQVYFPGYGWIDFEPTPAGTSGSEVVVDQPLVSIPQIEDLPIWNYWYYLQQNPDDAPGSPSGTVAPANTIYRSKVPFADQIGLALAIIGSLAVLWLIFYALSRIIRSLYNRQLWNVDRENPAVSAYINLYRLAALNNLVPTPQQTPQEFLAQIAGLIPEQNESLDLILREYQANRFGPDKGKPGLYQEAEILKARVMVYDAMLNKRGRLYRFFWKR